MWTRAQGINNVDKSTGDQQCGQEHRGYTRWTRAMGINQVDNNQVCHE